MCAGPPRRSGEGHGLTSPHAPDPPDTRAFAIDRQDEGQRLDVVLTRRLAGIRQATRTRVQQWVDAGLVQINGRRTLRPARPLHAGDIVEIALPWRREVTDHQPEDVPLTVLHEDAALLVVSKPAGMLIHPTGRHRTGTLFHALLWHARSWGTGARPGLVHRLDRDTSGVVVVAKSREVHARTVLLLRSRRARKRYLALVAGEPPPDGVLTMPLTRVSDSPPRMGVAEDGGLSCETRFAVVARGHDTTRHLALLACDLVTGRLHQIRAHLHAAGWPIVGDPIYGPVELPRELPPAVLSAIAGYRRQALHAWQLTLPHPVTGDHLHVTAPVPAELQTLLDTANLEVPAGLDSGR